MENTVPNIDGGTLLFLYCFCIMLCNILIPDDDDNILYIDTSNVHIYKFVDRGEINKSLMLLGQRSKKLQLYDE